MHASLTACPCCLCRKVDLQEHEILLKVHVPFTRQHEYVKEFKQAHRRDDDIAIVNAGMRIQMGQAEGEQCVLALGISSGNCALLAECGGGSQMGRVVFPIALRMTTWQS